MKYVQLLPRWLLDNLTQYRSYDAIIIGAGIIGCGISLALAKRGFKTLAIDKNPAAGYGSTSHSSAVIRTPYSTYAGCALAWESLHVWRSWSQFLGKNGQSPLINFIECGLLVTHDGDKSAINTSCEQLSKLNIPWQSWSTDQVKQHFPGLNLQAYAPPRRPEDEQFGEANGTLVHDCLWTPDAGYVSDPSQAAVNMKEAAEQFGAQFLFNQNITDIVKTASRASGVCLEDGTTIKAPIIVNAAGPYSSVINRLAGVTNEMTVQGRPMRQEVCHLPRPSGITHTEDEQLMIVDIDIGTYFRSEPGNSLLVGSTEPACDKLEWIDNADDYQDGPTEQWTALAYRTAQRITELRIPGQASGITGIYDATEDWTPIFDKSSLDGFYMACGTSGNQFKNGPTAGELMAGLIEYNEKGHDHDSEPFQFTCNYTSNSIDTSAFSRLRKIHKTSGNVMG